MDTEEGERQKYHKQKLNARSSSNTDEKRFVGIKGERRRREGPGNGSRWRLSGGEQSQRGHAEGQGQGQMETLASEGTFFGNWRKDKGNG